MLMVITQLLVIVKACAFKGMKVFYVFAVEVDYGKHDAFKKSVDWEVRRD